MAEEVESTGPDRSMSSDLKAENTVLRERVEQLETELSKRLGSGHAERFLSSIVDNIPHMIFVKDAAELRFVRVNKAEEQMIGLPREELIGRNDHDLFPKEEADFFTSKDRSVLKSGELLDIPEEPIQCGKGMLYLHTKKIPLYDGNGQPQYLLGISAQESGGGAAREEPAAGRGGALGAGGDGGAAGSAGPAGAVGKTRRPR
jgi:PAS domain S-box-containing protein